MNRTSFAAVVVSAVCFAFACGPAEHVKCDSSSFDVCQGTKAVLKCNQGSYRKFTCPGPRGCQGKDQDTTCDFTNSTVGAACPESEEGKAFCADDAVTRISCTNATWVELECGTCFAKLEYPESGKVSCTPKVGTNCGQVEGFTCENDRLVGCENMLWTSFPCPGPRHCELTPAQVFCDLRGAQAGDTCPQVFNDRVGACVSSTSFRFCHSGAFQDVACTVCSVDDGGISRCQ